MTEMHHGRRCTGDGVVDVMASATWTEAWATHQHPYCLERMHVVLDDKRHGSRMGRA